MPDSSKCCATGRKLPHIVSTLIVLGFGFLALACGGAGKPSNTSTEPKADGKGEQKGDSKGDLLGSLPADLVGEAQSDAYYFPAGTTSVTAVRLGDYYASQYHINRSAALAGRGGGVNVDEYNYAVPLTNISRIV